VTEVERYPALDWARRRWGALTLARQFVLAGAAVLVAGMAVIGFWVSQQIEASVTRNTATATALYVDSVIAPLLPDLRSAEALSEGARRALDETLSRGALGERLASFKIWKEDGLIAYSSRPELIGQRFQPTENLRQAWAGQIAAEFDKLHDEEDALERAEGLPLLEIYSPIREPWSGEVVAVAEFYEIAHELEANIRNALLSSALVVAIVTIAMMALLSGIVLRGSRIIAAQRQNLEARVAELSRLLAQNRELRLRVERASSRAVALNERYLKRISADLHDGPAQLLALASLKLGDSRLALAPGAAGELAAIREHLDAAMREIREICRGLTLPQIERLELPQLLAAAAAAHEQRTGTKVALTVPDEAPSLSVSEKICVFRFAQEGLNNAFRHAGGRGQSVEASVSGRRLAIAVADRGGGFDVEAGGDGLGLAGLRERVESLGGTFRVESSPSGTRLTMSLTLTEPENR
jgi:signal transduction histidine kinase